MCYKCISVMTVYVKNGKRLFEDLLPDSAGAGMIDDALEYDLRSQALYPTLENWHGTA